MTKITIGNIPANFKDYPKIMIEHKSGSIYWFQRENVGVLLIKGKKDDSIKEVSHCYRCSDMNGFVEFNLPITLQND